MSNVSVDDPNPITKAVEANQEAEDALKLAHPNVELAQAWAAISANWLSMVDPRSPAFRKMVRPR